MVRRARRERVGLEESLWTLVNLSRRTRSIVGIVWGWVSQKGAAARSGRSVMRACIKGSVRDAVVLKLAGNSIAASYVVGRKMIHIGGIR